MKIAKEVPVRYASGIIDDVKPIVVKNRTIFFLRRLYERYGLPSDKDIFEVVFHLDKQYRDPYQITILDSGKDGTFQSNLDFEGRITELVADLEKQKNVIQGYKMRAGRMRNKIEFLEAELEREKKMEVISENLMDEIEEITGEKNRSREIETNIQ